MVDHGWEHSEALYSLLPRFLWCLEEKLKENVPDGNILKNPAELYLLMVSSYLHDIGMNTSPRKVLDFFGKLAPNRMGPNFDFITNSSGKLMAWYKEKKAKELNRENIDSIYPNIIREFHPEIGAWICCGIFSNSEKLLISEIVLRHAKRIPKNTPTDTPEYCTIKTHDSTHQVRLGVISSFIAIADSCLIGGERGTGMNNLLEKVQGEITKYENILRGGIKNLIKEQITQHLEYLKNQPKHIVRHHVVSSVSLGKHGIIVVPYKNFVDNAEFQILDTNGLSLRINPEQAINAAHKSIKDEIAPKEPETASGVGYFLQQEFNHNIIPDIFEVSCKEWKEDYSCFKNAEQNEKDWKAHLEVFFLIKSASLSHSQSIGFMLQHYPLFQYNTKIDGVIELIHYANSGNPYGGISPDRIQCTFIDEHKWPEQDECKAHYNEQLIENLKNGLNQWMFNPDTRTLLQSSYPKPVRILLQPPSQVISDNNHLNLVFGNSDYFAVRTITELCRYSIDNTHPVQFTKEIDDLFENQAWWHIKTGTLFGQETPPYHVSAQSIILIDDPDTNESYIVLSINNPSERTLKHGISATMAEQMAGTPLNDNEDNLWWSEFAKRNELKNERSLDESDNGIYHTLMRGLYEEFNLTKKHINEDDIKLLNICLEEEMFFVTFIFFVNVKMTRKNFHSLSVFVKQVVA